ncbi:hypothetical protein [Longibacter salinarum]|uniref:hypothetical protein n=1 Tax=Longibacter salinarum TaxID=1850348 RepID=UPI00117DAE2A|nr:hypothetical protein [Longibacter salinarum]
MLILLYGLGWGDLIANGEVEVTGIQSIIRALPESFVYFVTILPYWWAVLLGLPLILAVVISSVAIVVKMLRGGTQSNHSAA